MDIGDIVSDSIKYPTTSWAKVLILGIIFITSFLIIPIFLAIWVYIQNYKSNSCRVGRIT